MEILRRMGMLQVIVTSVINPSTNNEWTVSRGSTGEEARNAAHHRKHSSSSYVSETVFGSPQNNATPTPRSSFEARKGSFSSLAEKIKIFKSSISSARAKKKLEKTRPKRADVLSKHTTNKLVNFWNTVDLPNEEDWNYKWVPDLVYEIDRLLPLPTVPEEPGLHSPRMDTSMLVPGGPDRRKQIQDANDMYQTVVRHAERNNSPVPPYTFLELIGKGSFGRVYKCLDKNTQTLVAVKIVNIDDMDFSADPRDRDETVKDFRKEVGILQQLKDSGARNVNLIHEAFDLHSQLWIISDYCTGGSVRTLMRANPTPRLEEHFIIPVARELAVAMKCVHDIGVIHRDIKCTNVYVTEEGQIQLGDFGIVGVMDDGASKRTTIIGTPWYMPREMHVDAHSVEQGYGTEVDIWSYGCTIYEMATGLVPNATIAMDMLSSVLESAPRLQGNGYSDELRDFVAFCLVSDPKARPTADQILQHPYIAGTERTYPTKSLVALIERYTMWEFKGGQRTSLFNPGGAAAPLGAGEFEDDPNDDAEDWNFSTSASFNQEFGKRYSHMILNGLEAPAGAGLPPLGTKNLTVFEQIQKEHKEKSATRGEMSLDRLFNPESAPYAMHASPVPTGPQSPPEKVSDLPLRSAVESNPTRESTVMIDLDADYGAGENFNFEFDDMPTVKANKGRHSFPDDEDDDEEEEEEDTYQYGQHDEKQGDKRATKDWKFPGFAAPAPAPASASAVAPKRATMDWTFSSAQAAEPDEADATMNLPPQGNGDVAPGFRPQLKHTATVPLGQFGDYLHNNQPPVSVSKDMSRDSVSSMIDLDLGFSDPTEIPPRPSTASSAAGSTGTEMTSGDPFDLDDQSAQLDRSRFSYHKQWQSDGGPTDSNRSSLRNVPMHARGSSLSSSASEMDRSIQVPAAAEDVFSYDYEDDRNRQPMQLGVPQTAPLNNRTDWPDFNRDFTSEGSPAYSASNARLSIDDTGSLNGTATDGPRSMSVSRPRDRANGASFGTPRERGDSLEFPNIVPPNPAALDEDASAAALAAELDRMLDDMSGAFKATSKALGMRAGLDEEGPGLDAGFSSSVEEETDIGFESADSVGFRSGVETGDEEGF